MSEVHNMSLSELRRRGFRNPKGSGPRSVKTSPVEPLSPKVTWELNITYLVKLSTFIEQSSSRLQNYFDRVIKLQEEAAGGEFMPISELKALDYHFWAEFNAYAKTVEEERIRTKTAEEDLACLLSGVGRTGTASSHTPLEQGLKRYLCVPKHLQRSSTVWRNPPFSELRDVSSVDSEYRFSRKGSKTMKKFYALCRSKSLRQSSFSASNSPTSTKHGDVHGELLDGKHKPRRLYVRDETSTACKDEKINESQQSVGSSNEAAEVDHSLDEASSSATIATSLVPASDTLPEAPSAETAVSGEEGGDEHTSTTNGNGNSNGDTNGNGGDRKTGKKLEIRRRRPQDIFPFTKFEKLSTATDVLRELVRQYSTLRSTLETHRKRLETEATAHRKRSSFVKGRSFPDSNRQLLLHSALLSLLDAVEGALQLDGFELAVCSDSAMRLARSAARARWGSRRRQRPSRRHRAAPAPRRPRPERQASADDRDIHRDRGGAGAGAGAGGGGPRALWRAALRGLRRYLPLCRF